MKHDGVRRLLILGAVLILIEVLGIGIYHLTTNFTFAAGGLHPRNLEMLDLRSREITPEEYARYQRRLPGTKILWTVPFQNGKYDSTVKSITVFTLSPADVSTLDYFTDLETLDGRGCGDYEALAEFQRKHPKIRVLYTITLEGSSYDQDTTEVTLKSLEEDAQTLLECLTHLETLHCEGCTEYASLARLQQTHSQWRVEYTVPLGNQKFPQNAANLTVYYATYDQLEAGLPGLPGLTTLNLMQPEATGQQLQQLREAYPQVNIRWQVMLFGQYLPDSTREADFTGSDMTLEQAESAAEYFPGLETLLLGECGGQSADLAAFRERMAGRYQVVWTVEFTKRLRVRTDAVTFCPAREGEYYLEDRNSIQELKYFEDLVCVDLSGQGVRDLSWLPELPNLRYLTLSRTNITDISPLEECKNLVYLDLSRTPVRDLTPLTGCTGLEDLCLSYVTAGSAPVRQMTWLKNLWWIGASGYVRELLRRDLPNTVLGWDVAEKWEELPNSRAQRELIGIKKS